MASDRINQLNILCCGAGMQSTALALMSCENARDGIKYPLVPIYDAIVFCDLCSEAPWVYKQVAFIANACKKCGISFYILTTDLYGIFMKNFGSGHVSSIPFWSIGADGKKAKMRRHCTIDFKIIKIQQFVRYELLGYRWREKLREADRGAHEMHIGFSFEEQQRIFDSYHPMFVNRFPLVEMGLTRADNYRYCLEVWGLNTKASACIFCPFHRKYFFWHLKSHHPKRYHDLVAFDQKLEKEQPNTMIRSKLFVSRSRKRIKDLTDAECNDAETFDYRGKAIWNGF